VSKNDEIDRHKLGEGGLIMLSYFKIRYPDVCVLGTALIVHELKTCNGAVSCGGPTFLTIKATS
jgi:hypothetical protein